MSSKADPRPIGNETGAAVQDEPARLLLEVLSLGHQAIERGEFSDAEDVFARLGALPGLSPSHSRQK